MYLGAVNIRMPDGSLQQASETDMAAIGDLVHARGGVPLTPGGSPFTVTQAFGGDLWNGCPIQVAVEESGPANRLTWVTGQPEVMKAAGMVPGCLVPGSPNYAAFYPASQPGPQSGSGTRTTYVGPGPAPTQNALFPTGVATPSIVPQPGGGAYYVAPETEETEIQQAGLVPEGSWWPWVLAALVIVPNLGKTRRPRRR